MGTSRGAAARRLAVRVSSRVWREEVERFELRSPPRRAAERERRGLEDHGVSFAGLMRCAVEGSDGTRLAGLVKVYVPISQGPPSERPFGFVLAPARSEQELFLAVVAFGERHPRPGVRSVYERAHRRLHGRYPDQ